MNRNLPEPGDLILVERSKWYALKDGEYLRVCEHARWVVRGRDLFVAPRKQVTTFWGPFSGPPGPSKSERMSTSGGPFKTITLKLLPPLERIGVQSDHFWQWRDFPRSGGGIEYQREITVWKLAELPDEGAYLDPESESTSADR